MSGESESGFHLPRGPSGEDGCALVSIRTGTNTSSECVGTLNMRLDVTLREVRQQLVSLALDAKASRKGRGSSVASAASAGAGARVASSTRAPLRAPPPPLTPAHLEILAKIRLHAFDFSSPFQFIKNGGVVVIPSHREDDLTVSELFPILPNTLVGEQKPAKQFCLPDEVELVGVAPPTKAGKKGPRFLRGGEDGQYVVAYAALFVRQKTKDHSEKVLMERLLMQNNVFGRLQTPQQLGTLISKYNANTKDFLGRTILQECSQEGNYYVVAFLLGHSFIKVEAADWRGQTALHLAVDRGHLEVVSLLLDAGSNVLAQDNCGRTPLHVALERGADVLAARLCARLHANGVTHDALAGYKDTQDKSPLDLFVEDSPSFIELCEAGMLPHLRTLWQHYLFDRRRVLERGVGGRTCLHVAVEARQIPVVDFLLNEVGMDAVLQDGCLDDSQRSPLHLACAQGLTAVVRHLLDLLDVNVTDCNIRTPLHHALMKKHADTAELILSRGAVDVDVMDINYCTPLHVAASHHMLRCCELLLTKHRANPALRGFSRTFACVRKPNVDVAAATVEERAEHRRARAKAERKWRMKTHEFKRRDAKTGVFMRRGQFEAEGRGTDWQESAVTLLAPRSEEDGGPDPSRKVELKGGLMLDWNNKGAHHANSKFNDTRFSGDPFGHEHIAHEDQHWLHGHYVKDPRLGSGLFWLRKRKSELQVKPPVVEILLRRRETDDDAGFDLGADMEVTDVTPESAADRAGLAMYMGYKLAEVKTELVIKRDGGDVGLTCDGNVVTRVASGGYAEAAGVKEGMRICAVNQRSPGEISHIPNCRDVVKTALSMAHPAKNLTLTVAVPVQGEHTVRRIPGSVYLRLQRPQLRAAPGASYELVQHTHAFASVLECAVAGRNYHATAALLLQHGAVQPNKEGAESLARIAAKLLDDRHLDLAEHVVRLMGETKGGLLHRYIGSGNHDAVRWLVEHGCSLFETHGPDELTPLALAAKTGDIRAVAYLLEHGAEDSVGEDGADPLLQAILAGKESVASLLVHLKPGRQKLLPMHVAASRGALKFGKALAGVNADLDAVTADGKTCLWVALEAAPLAEARVGRQKKKAGEKKAAAAAKQTRAEEDHEEFAVFLCSRGVDLSAGGRHPLDLVDLAAAKGMWRAVDALLDLMRKSYQEGALVRVAPYPEAPVPEGADAPDQAARRLNPAAAARRDVFSYAAECGRDDVLHRLAVTWGVPPSPGRDLAAVRRNALDYAFEGAKVEPCLMLLSRGLLPTKEASSRSKEVRALYSAVYSIIRESITQQKTGRKGSEKYSAPSKPFPTLPVNIFGYSTPGALLSHTRVGDRVQVLEEGQWCVGTVTEDTDDGVSVSLDWGGRTVFVEPSKSDIFRDVGHTLMHEFVQHGCLAFLEKLVSYSTSSPESAHRFSASMPPSTAGCLLYTAAVHNQEQVADYLLESQRMEATVFEGKSPLLAALLHGNFSMVQKLVGPGRADVNRVATLHGIPPGKGTTLRLLVGKEVSPLYLACATLDSAAVQLLLSKQAQPGLGRVTGDLVQSPLHACVSAAPRAATPQTQKYLPKKQVAAGKSALMIATVLAKATTDLDEVAVHYTPSSATGQHILNLAAAKGYWTIVKELLKRGSDVRKAVAAANLDPHSDNVFTIPHVLHYVARAGDVELLKLAVGGERCDGGAVDLFLPEGTAGEAVLRTFEKERAKRQDLGTTADQALHAHRPAALAFLLSRGVRLSRVATLASPRVQPTVLHFAGHGRRPSPEARAAAAAAAAAGGGGGGGRARAEVGRDVVTVSHRICGFLDIVERQSSRECGFTYLHAACLRPDAAETGRLLVEAGCDVNLPFTDLALGEITPVWMCAAQNNAGMLEALLQVPGLRFDGGRSPVPFAALFGQKTLLTRLLELRADPNYCEVLHYPETVRRRVLPCAQALVGAKFNLRFGLGFVATQVTALWKAALQGWDDTVAQLHAHGADLRDNSSVMRRALLPSLATYHRKAQARLKKKDEEDDYGFGDADGDDDSAEPALKFRARTKREIERRGEVLAQSLELPGVELELSTTERTHAGLVSAFGSLKEAYRACRRDGFVDAGAVTAVGLAAGLDEDEAEILAEQAPACATYAAFRALFAKRCHPGRSVSVSFLDSDAVFLRPIWAVLAGAPVHPCASRSAKSSLRELCDRYIRTAQYMIRADALAGLAHEELSALVLVACHKGHWEIAVMLAKEGSRAAGAAAGGTAASATPFLTEVPDEFLPGYTHIGKRHPLHVAAKHLDKDMFKMFLRRTKTQDVAALRDPQGYTVLHCAILANNADVVELLCTLPYVDLETPAGTGTQVHHKVVRGKLVKEVREASSGVTPLMLGARINSTPIVQRLLDAGAVVSATDTEGNTALLHAAEMGNFQIVELLVSGGADIACLNNSGHTALMRACFRGHNEVALPLLQFWTRQDGLQSQTTSVLHCAAVGNCEGVVEHLMADFDSKTINALDKDDHVGSMHASALWISWALGRWQIKAKLVEHLQRREEAGCAETADEADQRILDQLRPRTGGETDELEDMLLPGWLTHAVHLAARIHAKLQRAKGSAKTFPTELVCGPTVPALRESLRVGCTSPRMMSKRGSGHAEETARLEMLCISGTQKPYAERRKSWSLLEWATRANNAVVVKVMGDRSMPDSCEAVHLAAERGNLDIVQILLQLHMSSVSGTDSDGRTPLMRTIVAGKEKMALFLMSKTPARKLLKLTPDGQTLLHLCAQSGLEEAVTHMIGCLVQLERRLKGEDNLCLHDFVNITDRHPSLVDYDSEDEKEEKPRNDDDPDAAAGNLSGAEDDEEGSPGRTDTRQPTTGFTPFEYALMFGKPAIALRLAYGSTMSTAAASQAPSISLNPRFPGSAGYFLPVMSAGIRAMLSEFFNDPSRNLDSGPFTVRGDFVRHPTHWSQNDDGLWPREKSRLVFDRLTWPDVRAIGVAALARTPWVADRLAEVLTFEHERSKYSGLLSSLDLQGRAFRLNTASLASLGSAEKLAVLQHLASILIVHRYTKRDHDWTSATGAVQEDDVAGLDADAVARRRRRRAKEAADPADEMLRDGLVGQASCVQMEYVTDPGQVRVMVDSEGVVHERFTMVNGRFECASVETAVEAHFRRKERVAKSEADTCLREVNAWMRAQANPVVNKMGVSVDWKMVDRYRFDSPSDRIKSFEVLTSNRGIWSVVPALAQAAAAASTEVAAAAAARGSAAALAPFSGVVFRRAGFVDGQFFEDDAARAPESELVVLYDVREGSAHFSSLPRALAPLYVHQEREVLRRQMTEEQDAFRQSMADVLPDLRCKFEIEGSWTMLGGGDMLYCFIKRLLADIRERVSVMVKGAAGAAAASDAPQARKGDWKEHRASTEVSLQSLLWAALKYHVRSIGVLVSSKREATVKLAAASRTLIACVKVAPGGVELPSDGYPHAHIHQAVYRSVVDVESTRLQAQLQATLTDAEHRLATYLPNTALKLDWPSFKTLEADQRFVALGVAAHGRGAKVLQPLISGMIVGWDSKLGGFVRKQVTQVVVRCTQESRSSTEYRDGVLRYNAALLAAASDPCALMNAQEIASDVIIHLESADVAALTAEQLFVRVDDDEDPLLPKPKGKKVSAAAAPAASPVRAPAKITDHVDTTNAFPCWCSCSGRNLRSVQAAAKGVFSIRARNILNCACTRLPGVPPNEAFSVRFTTMADEPVDAGAKVVPPKPETPGQAAEDASLYKVRYDAPAAVGNYLIHVTLNGVPLPCSPVRLRVSPSSDPEELVSEQPHVTAAIVRLPVVFTFFLADSERNRVSTFGQKIQQGAEVTFAASSSAHDMELGPVVNDRNGSCSVRVVPAQPGDHDVTVTVTIDGVALACTQTFEVLDARHTLDHFKEHGLRAWEKSLRRVQQSKWEKEGWARWQREEQPPRHALGFPKEGGRAFTHDATTWSASLRNSAPAGTAARREKSYAEWQEFRRERVADTDGVSQPPWWLRVAATEPTRQAALRAHALRFAEYQETLMLRVAMQPAEAGRSLIRRLMSLPLGPANPFCEHDLQLTNKAAANKLLPTYLGDRYLQQALDRNGGADSKHSLKLPIGGNDLSETEQELKRRKHDLAVILPLFSTRRQANAEKWV